MKTKIDSKKITGAAKGAIKMVRTRTTALYNKSPILFIVIVLLLIGGGAYAYSKSSAAKSESYIVARGSLEEAVSVTGKIKASTDADLSFEKGGTVAAVYVKEGQKVYAGQTLMVLSGGTDYGQVLEARAGVQSAAALLDQLKNGTRKEQIAIKQAGLNSASVALDNSYATIGDTVRNSYNNASDAIRYKTQSFFTGTVSTGYRTTVTTCNSSLEGEAASARKQVEIDLENWRRIDTTNMSASQKEDTLSTISIYASRTSNLVELMNTIVTAPCVAGDTSLEPIRSSISLARASIAASLGAITQNKNQVSSAKSGISVSQSDLGLAQADNTDANKIKVQEAALRASYARLYQAQAASSKNVITAPGTGLVTKIDISAGEYASPGKSVARVVGTGEYTVEANVTESDIARIILENKAKVIIPAIDAKETFSGKVVSIDPAEQSSEGNPLYRIVVSLEGNDARIKSGMTAETTIVTSVVENILRVPTRFITKIKGVSKAQVVINGKTLETEERDVKTGRKSTDGNVEITSGLEEGEIIVLPTAPKK